MPAIQPPRGGHIALLLPLCTSSATLGLSLFQYPMFHAFLQSNNNAGRPLSRYWDSLILSSGGAAFIAGLNLTSAIAGTWAMVWLKRHRTLETGYVAGWYMVGAVAAVGHLAFVPVVAGTIKRMADAQNWPEDEAEVNNRQEMRQWFVVHTIRTALVDLPALWCFAQGAALSFWVI